MPAFLVGRRRSPRNGASRPGSEGRVDFFEELEEDHADRVALADQLIAAGVREPSRPVLWLAVWRGHSGTRPASTAIRSVLELPERGVEVGGGEPTTGGDVGEAHEGMHHRQLSRVIELEAWDPLSIGEDGRLGQFPQLAAVDKGLQDVLLDVVVVVDDLGHPVLGVGEGSRRPC